MAKKQFKIGEYAIGGIIQVETRRGLVKISALDYNSKKEVMSKEFDESAQRDMDNYLSELTSSYYTDKVMDWIKENTPMANNRV